MPIDIDAVTTAAEAPLLLRDDAKWLSMSIKASFKFENIEINEASQW